MRKQEQLTFSFMDSSPSTPHHFSHVSHGNWGKVVGGRRGRTNTRSDYYWSFTTNDNNPSNAWNVNFNNGNVNNNNKTNNNYVRAVRGGKYPGRLTLKSKDQSIFDLQNIYSAYLQCRKRKRNTINALKFEINQEEKLLSLQERLINRTYIPGRSILFAATRPKLREIFAAGRGFKSI